MSSMNKELITIGFDKNGEADFGINGDLAQLPLEKMKQLREMIPVAIGVAEDMWRREQDVLIDIRNRDVTGS